MDIVYCSFFCQVGQLLGLCRERALIQGSFVLASCIELRGWIHCIVSYRFFCTVDIFLVENLGWEKVILGEKQGGGERGRLVPNNVGEIGEERRFFMELYLGESFGLCVFPDGQDSFDKSPILLSLIFHLSIF